MPASIRPPSCCRPTSAQPALLRLARALLFWLLATQAVLVHAAGLESLPAEPLGLYGQAGKPLKRRSSGGSVSA